MPTHTLRVPFWGVIYFEHGTRCVPYELAIRKDIGVLPADEAATFKPIL